MNQIPGYSAQGLLHDDGKVRLFRARRETDGSKVLVKEYLGKVASEADLRRHRAEFDMVHKLRELSGVARADTFEQRLDSTLLVMEDADGVPLETYLRTENPPLYARVALAESLVKALGQIHKAGVIHNNLSPRNILVHPRTQGVQLMDFGSASALAQESRELSLPETLVGTPHYMSPEQTGRMNRTVDYRSDYYALGAVLFEIFTGRTVYEGQDVLELLHCHLAKAPPTPRELNPELPPVLSELLLKLLAKHAEDRYQSADGIALDLAEIAQQLKGHGSVQAFPLARYDLAKDIVLSERLYGREREVEIISRAFAEAAAGHRVLLRVGGSSGVGKTRLVNEVHRPLTQRGGLFLSGKFEALKRNVPFHALSEAFGGVLEQLLALPETRLSPLRETLTRTLAPSAQSLCDVFPQLASLLGPQAKQEELSPNEAHIRFELQFTLLVQGLLGLGRHLVLFLDDMQAADQASLKVLKTLLRTPQVKHLLIIAAYRDTEVLADHPLHELAQVALGSEVSLFHLVLQPLGPEHVLQMVTEALQCDATTATSLASVISLRSGGNPLFVREFLRALHQSGALERNTDTRQWRVDSARLQQLHVPDNVVDLLLETLHRLPAQLQQVLSAAAALGREVDSSLLALALDLSEEQTLEAIAACSASGLFIWVREAGEARAGHFRFVHDKVQEAATLLRREEERAHLHARVGQLLLERLSPEQREKNLFELVNHLNLGAKADLLPETQRQLARLNLDAGRRAMASVAHEVAATYFDRGLEWLSPTAWNDDYPTARGLHEDGAEAALLQARFDVMETRARQVEAHARSPLDELKINELRIHAMVMQNRPIEACDAGIRLLRRLGIRLPFRPGKLHAAVAILRNRRALKQRGTEGLKAMPPMTDPISLAAMRILALLNYPAFLSSVDNLAVLSSKQVELTLKHGNAPVTCSLLGGYGTVMLVALNDVKLAKSLVDVALHLGQRPEGRKYLGRTRVLSSYFILHRYGRFADSGSELLQGYRESLEGGDYEYASLATSCRAFALFHSTPHLETALKQLEEGARVLETLGQDEHLLCFQGFHRQLGFNLTHPEVEAPWKFQGPIAHGEKLLARMRECNNHGGLASSYYFLVVGALLFDRREEAKIWAFEAAPTAKGIETIPMHGRALTAISLALLESFENLSRAEQHQARKIASRALARVNVYNRDAPLSYGHMVLMLRAALARCEGDLDGCCKNYEAAAKHAKEQSRDAMFESLSYELAARACLRAGRELQSRGFLHEALLSWTRWGAWSKVAQLQREHPRLQQASLVENTHPASPLTPLSSGSEGLDLQTVLKASHALARELELGRLMNQMMGITLESAGADGAALLLHEEGTLRLKIQRRLTHPEAPPVEFRNALLYADSVVQYVVRTLRPVVVDDARVDERFRHDPHVVETAPRSVLGLPIFQSGELVGVLYLENQKLSQAFSPKRVELLTLLAAQAAISIAHARLYGELGQALAQAQESSRLKSEFLANVSHELRTPLNAIINIPQGLLECLVQVRGAVCMRCQQTFELDDHEVLSPSAVCANCRTPGVLRVHNTERFEWDTAHAVRHLRSVVTSGKQLLRVVTDVLDSSKLEFGEVEILRKSTPLHLLLDAVEQNFSSAAERAGVSLQVQPCAEGLSAELDLDRIAQVLFNLVANAIKFSDGKGTVTVRAECEGNWARFHVQDEGVGIDPSQHALIFERFRQVEGGHTRRFGGTGLGLAIAQKLTGLHGGQIRVQSQPGAGSLFTVELPVNPPAA